MNKDLDHLQSQLDIAFNNPTLLEQAFTHSSYVNENRFSNMVDNERLEFLGDAVVELVVSDYLFERYKRYSEGELTKLRATIVCEPSLMKFAQTLHLGDYVLLGKGEETTGGRSRPALLADLFEAFVGALYLDQGLEVTRKFFAKHVFPAISVKGNLRMDDYKSRLQEYTQQRNLGVLAYHIVDESGPAHDRVFVSEVHMGDQLLGQGKGRSKKEAEQQAASYALQKLNDLK